MKVEHSEFQTVNDTTSNKYYTKLGSQDFMDDESNPRLNTESSLTCAKSVKSPFSKTFTYGETPTYKYFIKTDPNHNLFNPVTNFSGIAARPNFINKICKSEQVYTEVNKSVFDKYVSFLRTLNVQWLTSAQREMR